MQDDDHVCLCFRVSRRKLVNWVRLYHPSVPSQLSACGGAGTGCGWCIPFLKRIFSEVRTPPEIVEGLPSPSLRAETDPLEVAQADWTNWTAEEYARRRAEHIRSGHGTLPAEEKSQ